MHPDNARMRPGGTSGRTIGPRAASAQAAAVPAALIVGLALAACSPSLDWREVRTPGMAAAGTLPCKPSVSTREVPLAGQTVRMTLMACKAEQLTWALAGADVADPSRVGPALNALRDATRANLGGRFVEVKPVAVRGATPHEAQVRAQVSGRRQDGAATTAEVVVFSYGTQVFQAVVMGGGAVPEAATATFFESLRAGP